MAARGEISAHDTLSITFNIIIDISKGTWEWLTTSSYIAKLTLTLNAASLQRTIQSYNSLPF